MPYSDKIVQFTFLLIHYTLQKCKSRNKYTIVQLNKILPECKYPAPVIAFKRILSTSKQYLLVRILQYKILQV